MVTLILSHSARSIPTTHRAFVQGTRESVALRAEARMRNGVRNMKLVHGCPPPEPGFTVNGRAQ